MAPASDSNNEGVANEGVNENGSSNSNNSAYVSKGSPPPYDHALYANYGKTVLQNPGSSAPPQPGAELQIASFTNPTPATTSASYVGVGTTSFTNTFLRGILTSIDRYVWYHNVLKSHKMWHFSQIFALLKLVTLYGRRLQAFKNSPKCTILW